MEVHQIRYALAVADAQSFTRAAAALHVSQSGVSAQVALLERELGVVLFDRTPRGATLTAAGEAVLAQLRRADAALHGVRDVADDLNGLLRGAVAIGAVAGFSWPPFYDALQQVHDEHPGLQLTLREGNSALLQDEVATGRLDLAVATWADAPRPGLDVLVAIEERVTAFVGPVHPWRDRTEVTAAELAGASVICLPPGSGMRGAYDAMMSADRVAAPVTWEVTLPSTARALAARGMGVAVLTSSRADPSNDLHALQVVSEHAQSRLGLVWRAGQPPSAATRRVIEVLAARFSEGAAASG